jgi:hypothetical protein
VCAGVVQARACVITDLAEIDQLKDGPWRKTRPLALQCHLVLGDVLITYCTDIGWSPYFPMLGGIATELGGLVSHGNLQFMVHPIQKLSFFRCRDCEGIWFTVHRGGQRGNENV